MNAAQHQLFNQFVQAVEESRGSLHLFALQFLAVLMLAAIVVWTLVWIWILRGGLSRGALHRVDGDRRLIEQWLRES